MFVLLLTACGSADALDDARDRAEAFLEEHPRGTAIVQAPLARDAVEGVVGARWNGADLAAWLAPCEPSPGAFQAELRLEPGSFPWTLADVDGALGDCAKGRLRTFPFEEPSRRGETDLVIVRWRPDEIVPAAIVREEAEAGPEGLAELAPPYYRRSPDGDALRAGHDLHVDDGRVRIRPTRGGDVVSGPLDDPQAWARQLTCPADRLDLVRATLVFDDGSLEEVDTAPTNDCVEDKVRDAWKWLREQTVGGERVADAGRVLVVLDVPVGAW